MKGRFSRLATVLVLLATLAAFLANLARRQRECNKYVVHPGSLSAFDSKAYDALLTAQAAIDEGRNEYAQGKLPPASKDLLNKAIAVYNTAEASWHTYHDTAAAAKSGNTSQLAAELQADLDQLSAAIAEFETSAGKKTGPSPPVQ